MSYTPVQSRLLKCRRVRRPIRHRNNSSFFRHGKSRMCVFPVTDPRPARLIPVSRADRALLGGVCGGDFATLIRRCRGTTLPFAHDACGALWAVRLPRLHAGDWSLVLCMRRTAGLWHRPSSNVRFAEFYLQTTVQQEIRNPLDREKSRVLIREVTGSKPISMFRPRAHGPSCLD